MAKRKHNKRWEVALKMPPLKHRTARDEEYDVRKSEVAQWLCAQPEIMQLVFEKVGSSKSGLGFIVYNSETGEWRGRDYAE